MSTFETTVSGIPCQCEVLLFNKGDAPTWDEPGCGDEFEFRILDRKGYKAAWLERKLTDEDHDRLLSEYLGEA